MVLSVQVTLPTAGTYLIFSRLRADFNTATYAASPIITAKLARVNNTPADLVSPASTPIQVQMALPVVTVSNDTIPIIVLPFFAYTTTTTGDEIQLQASMTPVPDNNPTGVVNANDGEIVALKLF